MQGAAYLALGEYAKAEPLMTQSLPVLQKRFGDSHFRVQRAFRDLVQLYTATGQPQEASRFRENLISETPNPDVKEK
jgi:hypothetical protein